MNSTLQLPFVVKFNARGNRVCPKFDELDSATSDEFIQLVLRTMQQPISLFTVSYSIPFDQVCFETEPMLYTRVEAVERVGFLLSDNGKVLLADELKAARREKRQAKLNTRDPFNTALPRLTAYIDSRV